ncbi:molybdenum-pterin-binding protein [Hydrogenobacter thermophilus]|uniref:molybdenum-pterin-binding protein n=1 Tax=Hydrogenobacter thermophilus TaxID=940 RepID=UPI0030FCEF99
MNLIRGKIKSIRSTNGVSEVEVQTSIGILYSVVLESPGDAEFVRENSEVECIFKEASVVVLREATPCINTFKGLVKSIDKGFLLSLLTVDCEGVFVKAMLLRRQLDLLKISEGDTVHVFLPPMQIALEVIHE